VIDEPRLVDALQLIFEGTAIRFDGVGGEAEGGLERQPCSGVLESGKLGVTGPTNVAHVQSRKLVE
jgi:hypothetical protein